MPDRNAELRASVRRLESNAKRKLRRNRAKGIGNVEAFSPIRPSIEVGSLDKRHLTTYMHQLQRFNSRRNQFLKDANGEALPSHAWKEYKAKERRYANKVNSIYNEVKGLVLPNGKTIEEKMNTTVPLIHPGMANQAVNALFRPPNREPGQVNGTKGLSTLNKNLDKYLKDDYFEFRRNADKETLEKILDMFGEEDLKNRVLTLTDKQFDVLWNYTDFVIDALMQYESAQKALEDPNYKKSKALEAIDAGALNDLYDNIDWVELNV